MVMFESDEVNIYYLLEIEVLVKSYIIKVVKSKVFCFKVVIVFKFEIKDGCWEKEELFMFILEVDEIIGYVVYMYCFDIFFMDGIIFFCYLFMNILICMVNFIGINEFYVICLFL